MTRKTHFHKPMPPTERAKFMKSLTDDQKRHGDEFRKLNAKPAGTIDPQSNEFGSPHATEYTDADSGYVVRGTDVYWDDPTRDLLQPIGHAYLNRNLGTWAAVWYCDDPACRYLGTWPTKSAAIEAVLLAFFG
jgi:hypothetical protein